LRARFRSIVIAAAVSVTGCGEGEVRGRAGAASAPAEDGEIAITRVGFSTPESVIHDSVADVYLVSNIEGAPAAKDDNGFIARLSPDGYVQQLRWIDGAAQNVTLHAPKGMAISGDTLYVADIDCVRRFVRTTGATAGDICAFEGATFLNDIAVDSLGTLYVTDSGLEPDLTPSGTDAIWRFTPAGLTGKVVEGSLLGAPNGIAFRGQDGFVVTFRSGELYQIGPSNNRDIILSGWTAGSTASSSRATAVSCFRAGATKRSIASMHRGTPLGCSRTFRPRPTSATTRAAIVRSSPCWR
jgi:hypothetical protein